MLPVFGMVMVTEMRKGRDAMDYKDHSDDFASSTVYDGDLA